MVKTLVIYLVSTEREIMMNTKSKIYVLVLIWAAALIQLFINASVNREEKLVEQAMSLGVENLTESQVKAYAFYGNETLSSELKETMAKRLASELGIVSGYEITHRQDGEHEITELAKQGAKGDTEIKIITLSTVDEYGQTLLENYIMIQIDLKQDAGTAVYDYKEKLSELYAGLGMSANTNIYLCSQVKGKMTEGEMEDQIGTFMEEMDARQVQYDTFDDVVCVYGYSRNIDEFVYQDSHRVNVNIAFSYDAEDDVTYIHRAVPFVDRSF